MRTESAFTMDTSSIKYGPGATREVGHDVRKWGARRVMVVTDPNVDGTEPVAMELDALRESGIHAVRLDQLSRAGSQVGSTCRASARSAIHSAAPPSRNSAGVIRGAAPAWTSTARRRAS